MKRILTIAAMIMLCSTSAYADLLGARQRPVNENLKASQGNYALDMTMPDPDTILAWITALGVYAAPREGFMYDVDGGEFVNFFGSTIYTIDPAGVSFSVGLLNTHGFAFSCEYNLGQHLPADGVPIAEFLQYLYIGVAAGSIDREDGDGDTWEFAWGPTASVKFTF